MHSRRFCLQFLQRGSHVEIWTLFLQVLHFGQFAAVCCCSVRAPSKLVSATVAFLMFCDHTQSSIASETTTTTAAILAQDCPRTNREVYKFDGEVVEKVFDGSSSEAKQRRSTSACGGVRCTRASGEEPVVEYISPAPAVILSVSPLLQSIAPAPAVFQAPVFPLSLSECLGHVFA